MINKIIGGIAVLALVLSIVGLVGNKQPVQSSFGGTTNYDALTLDNGDLTLTNGNIINSTAGKTLTLTTSNTATSTLKVGCIQMNATSTATNIRLLFSASATTTISGTASGTVAWGYGTCPF